jgi:hypothetical protein
MHEFGLRMYCLLESQPIPYDNLYKAYLTQESRSSFTYLRQKGMYLWFKKTIAQQ